MCKVLNDVRAEGIEEGKKATAGLMAFLASNGRTDDIVRANSDESFLDKLLSDFRTGLLKPAE